jgi:hypothetical protein
VELVRDMLDKKVVDRHGREMGRVDSIVLEVRGDAPPRVVGIEMGPAVLFARVRPLLGRLARAIEVALGIDGGRPVRIAFADILDSESHVKVDAAAAETATATLEKRAHAWIGRIPGAS